MSDRKDWLDYRFRSNNDGTFTLMNYTLMETKAKIPHVVAGCKLFSVSRWAFSFANPPYYESAPLEEIELEEGYRTLNHGSFYGCKLLKKLILPSTVDTINGNPFEGAESLEEIVFPNGNKHFIFKDGKLMSADGTKIYFERKAY